MLEVRRESVLWRRDRPTSSKVSAARKPGGIAGVIISFGVLMLLFLVAYLANSEHKSGDELMIAPRLVTPVPVPSEVAVAGVDAMPGEGDEARTPTVEPSAASQKPLEEELATIDWEIVNAHDIRAARSRSLLEQLSETLHPQ